MNVLGFDTATDDTVVAAVRDGDSLFDQVLPPVERRPQHSQMLLELVEGAAATLGGWDAVDRIAVGIGPGTFTGIRIGVATAAGLAASTGKEVTGVPTLAALARSIGRSTGAAAVMPLIDARRGEVFGGLHTGEGSPLENSFACGPEELGQRLKRASLENPVLVVAGTGAVRFRDDLLSAGLDIEPAGSPVHRLSGSALCELGETARETGPDSLKPLYLRVPDAQLWLERDGKPVDRNET